MTVSGQSQVRHRAATWPSPGVSCGRRHSCRGDPETPARAYINLVYGLAEKRTELERSGSFPAVNFSHLDAAVTEVSLDGAGDEAEALAHLGERQAGFVEPDRLVYLSVSWSVAAATHRHASTLELERDGIASDAELSRQLEDCGTAFVAGDQAVELCFIEPDRRLGCWPSLILHMLSSSRMPMGPAVLVGSVTA